MQTPVSCSDVPECAFSHRLGMCGMDFLNFCSVSVQFLKKKSDLVRNQFRSVQLKNAVQFGYYS